MTHNWSDKNRPDERHTRQCCWSCGMERVGRHENGKHWTEFYLRGRKVSVDKTPECEGRIEMQGAA